jgi:endonuclease YncB( thermonuclease family)
LQPAPVSRALRRRRIIQAAWAALATISATWIAIDQYRWPGDDWATWDRRRVVIVATVSGDTVRVRPAAGAGDALVKLLGLQSPDEASQRLGWTVDELARGVADKIAADVGGKPVLLRLEPLQTREPDGRLRATLYLSDADNFNADLVRAGVALPDQSDCSTMPLLIDAQILAKRSGAGMWDGWQKPRGNRSRDDATPPDPTKADGP